MTQIHKRFTVEQLRVLLQGYCEGALDRAAVEEILGIGKTRFFALVKEYRNDPVSLSLAYERRSPSRLSGSTEAEMEKELTSEKALIDDASLPISTYNYSAMRDHLAEREISVSLSTIIRRAKQLDCYQQRKKKGKTHDREVVTTAAGMLVQHDASHHRWSPYAEDKWVLITSLDDFSRMLLYADFVSSETTWSHITAAEGVMRDYGLPLRYYVDSLRVFRFIQGRDSNWRKHVLQTDEADPQWRQVMSLLGVEVIYALSPQAKGKIERPYRWLQDRIVRTCARERLKTIDEARGVLKHEVHRYNNHQVHSTTGQIPAIRFDQARKEGKSLFRPLAIPGPYTSLKDIFCLREKRRTDGYRRVSLFRHQMTLSKVPIREEVDIHLIPNPTKGIVDIRVWWDNQLVHSETCPDSALPSVRL